MSLWETLPNDGAKVPFHAVIFFILRGIKWIENLL